MTPGPPPDLIRAPTFSRIWDVSLPDQTVLRCSHCGRPVRATTHTRESWRVDFYLLHAGDVEPAVFRRDEEGIAIPYLRLVHPQLSVTCAGCYGREEIRASRLFPEELEE